MTASTTTHSATQSYQLINDKRQALEQLIKIASGVQHQQSALSELAFAVRPSQEFPAKMVSYYAVLEKKMEQFSSAQIIKKLESLEKVTASSLKKMLALAKIDIEQLRDQKLETLNLDSFSQFIDSFKRRTQTSLAIRLLLKKRGMAIAPLNLPISQEALNNEIVKLKEKEQSCLNKVREEIKNIIDESQTLKLTPGLPDTMKNELDNLVKGMQVNLLHLDRGGAIDKLPNTYEIIVLESEQPQTKTVAEKPNEGKAANPEDKIQKPDIKESSKKLSQENNKSPSTWWLLKTWLTSPWGTSWKALKQKHSKTNN